MRRFIVTVNGNEYEVSVKEINDDEKKSELHETENTKNSVKDTPVNQK